MAAKDTKRVSWKRIGLCLAIIFAAGWLALLLTLHVGVWYLAKKEALDPKASIMPRPLPTTALGDIQGGDQVSALGYNAAVPWKVVKRSQGRMTSMFTLANGTQIAISPGENGMGPGLIAHSTPSQAAAYRSLYGSLALSSRYGWLNAELNSSPADISFWRSRASNAKAMTFMALKEGSIGESKVVYTMAAGGMHGFQIGDPQQRGWPVWLWLVDAKDREIWIILYRAHNGPAFTQEQINAMVASIRPTQ
jgi:hypothetical protein